MASAPHEDRHATLSFPAFQPDLLATPEEEPFGVTSSRTASPSPAPRHGPANGSAHGARHGRQKSLSEAIRTMRTRKMSVSQNAHEIADALKAPLSWRLIVRPPSPPAAEIE